MSDYEIIIKHYGEKNQLIKAVEEMSELSQLLCREVEDQIVGKKHIVEEMADVQIMLEQLKIIYGISDDNIQEMMMYKIRRTLERIKNTKKES